MRKNLSVMGIANLITFLFSFASVLFVSRMLSPTEIGVFSVSVAVLGLAHILREFGVSNYLVQAAEVSKTQFRAAFSVTLFTSWFIAIILYFGRYPMAEFYQHQGVADILILLAFNFIILPFGAPLLSMMRRDLQFNKLALGMVIPTIVQAVVTVYCAWSGESYLSMAWGAVASHLSRIVLLNVLRPGETYILPTTKGLGEVLRFGSISSLTSIIKELGTSAPDLILGRSLGFTEVAILSRAAGLQKMLIDRFITLVRGVHFPTFAKQVRAGGDGAKLYAVTMNYMVSVTAPLLAVLAIISEPLIVWMFGEQWTRAAGIATMLCGFSILTTPYALYQPSLTAVGKVSLVLKSELFIQSIKITVLLLSFWIALEQVVALMVIVFAAEAVLCQRALHKGFGLTFKGLLKEVQPSFILIPCSVIGPLAVIYLAHLFSWSEQRFLILAASCLLATLGWLAGIYSTNHVMKPEVINILTKLSQKLMNRRVDQSR